MVHSVPELMVSAEVSHVMATWETLQRPTYFTFIIINIPYLMFCESHVNVCCIYSQPCKMVFKNINEMLI